MTRFISTCVVLIAGVFPIVQEPAQFRSTASELVVLPVHVTDRTDHYVGGLTQDEFSVFDNGRRVSIDFFSSEDTPVTVGLVIDSSSSMRAKLGDVIAGAMAFAKASNPNDELFAIYFNDVVHETIPSQRFLLASDLADLGAALSSLVAEGRTSLYDALIDGLDRLAGGSRPRKVLVLVSDGGDNASTASLEHILTRARRSNAAIYTIGLYEPFDLDQNPRVLKALAAATGGERFLPKSAGAVLQACQHIAREIRSGYTIGYVPPDRDGTFHRVRVEAAGGDRRKLSARTRPGYFAAQQSTEQDRR
jgi:Ca-activated chloride channel family protein